MWRDEQNLQIRDRDLVDESLRIAKQINLVDFKVIFIFMGPI
jgi:hypothetical protein